MCRRDCGQYNLQKAIAGAVVAVALIGMSPAVFAEEGEPSLFERDALFGDWDGLRPWLENKGLTLESVYTAEVFMNTTGGFTPTIELVYKAQVFGWLSVKPDVQYIANPGGTEDDDAVAVGPRYELLF